MTLWRVWKRHCDESLYLNKRSPNYFYLFISVLQCGGILDIVECLDCVQHSTVIPPAQEILSSPVPGVQSMSRPKGPVDVLKNFRYLSCC